MRLLTSLLFLFSLTLLTSCDSDELDGLVSDWARKTDFAGTARTGAVAFTLDGKAYVGTGFDGKNRLADFWQYTPESDSWTRVQDFPGVARSGAVSFTANGKGYIGTGYDGTNNLRDFWQYDPTTDTWTQVADFAGTARYGAIAMALENKGYIGGGFDGAYLKDFWQYDPASDTWTEKPSFSGARRVNGFAFVVNGKGYVGGGLNNGILEADLFEYTPGTSTWRNLKNLNSNDRNSGEYPSPRTYGTVFAVQDKAYLVGGTDGLTPTNNASMKDVWVYNPATDKWRELEAENFSRSERESAIGFSIGDFGYLGLGRTGYTRYSDLWQLNITK
ncbi:galactose oxidase [Pontibacter sp. E15-1]|uniref:Kelch repeat-containing protein n=1 Tax=Pontibacter sp. E15-1 TaxID=2919918 RepID=UPI001F4F961F|nr:kelch repeat-containing protein [Pontibacter sp. E15-1]MCJ8166996.1 galactose oxidase [Pontibacter sp. E15-1]